MTTFGEDFHLTRKGGPAYTTSGEGSRPASPGPTAAPGDGPIRQAVRTRGLGLRGHVLRPSPKLEAVRRVCVSS